METSTWFAICFHKSSATTYNMYSRMAKNINKNEIFRKREVTFHSPPLLQYLNLWCKVLDSWFKQNISLLEEVISLSEGQKCVGLVHWDDPKGWYGEGGGRKEAGSGWGACVYLWWIHVDIWQNQYNIVKLKNKIK